MLSLETRYRTLERAAQQSLDELDQVRVDLERCQLSDVDRIRDLLRDLWPTIYGDDYEDEPQHPSASQAEDRAMERWRDRRVQDVVISGVARDAGIEVTDE